MINGLISRRQMFRAGAAVGVLAASLPWPRQARAATGIDARLGELGIELPDVAAPVANYVPYVVTGNLVFVAGQGPWWKGDSKGHVGRVGSDLTVDQGREAARRCAINILAALKAACGGNLDRVVRCVKVGGFVNSAPDFFEQPKVVNGASDLFVAVFGDAGRHARFAVGASVLPFNIATEIDAHFEIA